MHFAGRLWILDLRNRGLRAARQIWPPLTRAAGYTPADFALSVLSARAEGGDRARVVVLADGPARLVLKFRLNADPAQHDTTLRAHETAAAILRDVPDCAAPDVLARHADTGALLLSWVRGRSLFEVLAEKPGQMDVMMGHVGRWMAALHHRGEIEETPFKGGWMLGRLDRMAAGGVPDPHGFAACRRVLAQVERAAHGKTMPRAMIHGDLSLTNLIWDGRVLTGIDFENTGLHPVARDAAAVLCDCAVWFGPSVPGVGDPSGQSLLPGQVMDAFATGLGAQAVDPAVQRFFIGMRLLSIWAQVPVHARDRSLRRARVWQGVEAAAKRVLRDVP
jgi:tRNA A-37 threonylcarbamoyl transferase component Bud32